MSITCSLNMQYLNHIRAFAIKKLGARDLPWLLLNIPPAIFIGIGEKIDNQKSWNSLVVHFHTSQCHFHQPCIIVNSFNRAADLGRKNTLMLSKVYDKKASNSLLCLYTRIAILFFLLFCCVMIVCLFQAFVVFLQELGILDNPNYKICFLLDSGAMITVLSSKYGLIEVIYIREFEYSAFNF